MRRLGLRYIETRFKADGVTNAIWVWCPNAGGQAASAYYTGDASVDWLSFDNYAPSQNASFKSTLMAMYTQLAALNATKPILVAESATLAANQFA